MINGLLKAQIQATDFLNRQGRGRAGGQRPAGHADRQEPQAGHPAETFKAITFTNDPIASSLLTDAQHATAVGLLDPVSNLSSIYDLGPLNKLLSAAGNRR